MSLQTKLKSFMLIILIPMVCLVIGILIKFREYTDEYIPIVEGINIANEFDMHFKEEVDYLTYRITIGSLKFEDSGIKEVLKKTKGSLYKLKEGTSLQSNKKQIAMAEKNLELLEKQINVIRENCKTTGHYDENMLILDNDIYVFTQLISDEIREYAYYEALELHRVGKNVQEKVNELLNISLIIFLGVILVTWCLIILISNSITKPLQYLCKRTREIGAGDFTTPTVSGVDEVATLARSFNIMVKKVEGLVERAKYEQEKLRKTELKLLQAQINPHFLYNTLDTIIWMAEDGKGEEVVQIVSALSDFFRVSLSKGREYITLREEEKHIRSYLQIQQFRYADIMSYEINIPQELGEYRLLKLILQPLVENALYHGVKQKRGQSKITVTASCSAQAFVLKVIDNGRGMTEEELEKVKRSLQEKEASEERRGFGLANVNERIKLSYGEDYGLHITSTFGCGTIVEVHLPMEPINDEIGGHDLKNL